MIDLRSLVAVVREAVAEFVEICDFLIRKADDRWILPREDDTRGPR